MQCKFHIFCNIFYQGLGQSPHMNIYTKDHEQLQVSSEQVGVLNELKKKNHLDVRASWISKLQMKDHAPDLFCV